jgi:hypothetical protein
VSGLFWLIISLKFIDSQSPPQYSLVGSWLIYLITEVSLFALECTTDVGRYNSSGFNIVSRTIRFLLLTLLSYITLKNHVNRTEVAGVKESKKDTNRDEGLWESLTDLKVCVPIFICFVAWC